MTANVLDLPTATSAAIIEYDLSAAKQELTAAWSAYKTTAEPAGLKFGETLYEWRKKYKAVGFRGKSKGQGFLPILEQCGIPRSTAYWWIEHYEISIGLRDPEDATKPDDAMHDHNYQAAYEFEHCGGREEQEAYDKSCYATDGLLFFSSEAAAAHNAQLAQEEIEQAERDEIDKQLEQYQATHRQDEVGIDESPTPTDTPTPVSEPVPGDTEPTAPEVKRVHSEGIAHGGFWEDLYHTLNALVPAVSDSGTGTEAKEHIVAAMLQEALTKAATTQAEQNFRGYVISLLNKVSKDFAEYAQKLNQAEVV